MRISLNHCVFRAASAAQYCGANAYFTMFSWLPSYFSDNFPDAKVRGYSMQRGEMTVFV